MSTPKAPAITMPPATPSVENPYTQQAMEEQQQLQAKTARQAMGRSKTMLSGDVNSTTGERRWDSLLGG